MGKLRSILLCLCAVAGLWNATAQNYYTLQSCLAVGLEQNYAIRIAQGEEQIASNNVTLGNAGFLPEIGFSAGYGFDLTHSRSVVRADGSRVSDHGFNQSLTAGLDVSWTIFEGLQVQTNYKRLQEMERMGEIATRIAVEDFVASLAAEYYNYVQQRIRLKNFLYAVSLSRERLRIVEVRYKVGNYSRLDLQQARVDFNADSSQYISQQEAVEASRIRLNELMANPDVNAPLTVFDTMIDLREHLDWATLLDGMLQTNAALLQAERSRTLVELDLKTVQSRNYPYLRANAGYGYSLNTYGSSSNSNRRRHQWGPDAGVTLGITIFDGNRRRENLNARIAVDNAKLEEAQLEQSLRADLADFWQAYENNQKLLILERGNLGAAKENYEIARERYELGDLSGIEMREAQKSLLDAEERILVAEYNTKLCEISLMQISGKVLSYLK